jgi:hypothetical protein
MAIMAVPSPPSAAQAPRAVPGPGPDHDALGLMRILNSIEAIMSKPSDSQHPEIRVYASKAEILGNEKPGLAWQLDNPLQSDPLLTKLNPNSPTGEVLPGWILDFASKPNGYVMALVQKSGATRKVFVTDETAVIYRTDMAENLVPSLTNINHASEYSPGIVDFDRYYSQQPAAR